MKNSHHYQVKIVQGHHQYLESENVQIVNVNTSDIKVDDHVDKIDESSRTKSCHSNTVIEKTSENIILSAFGREGHLVRQQ